MIVQISVESLYNGWLESKIMVLLPFIILVNTNAG